MNADAALPHMAVPFAARSSPSSNPAMRRLSDLLVGMRQWRLRRRSLNGRCRPGNDVQQQLSSGTLACSLSPSEDPVNETHSLI